MKLEEKWLIVNNVEQLFSPSIWRYKDQIQNNIQWVISGVISKPSNDHICTTIALYDKVTVIEDHLIVDQWEIGGRTRY